MLLADGALRRPDMLIRALDYYRFELKLVKIIFSGSYLLDKVLATVDGRLSLPPEQRKNVRYEQYCCGI